MFISKNECLLGIIKISIIYEIAVVVKFSPIPSPLIVYKKNYIVLVLKEVVKDAKFVKPSHSYVVGTSSVVPRVLETYTNSCEFLKV
jgi:hypothetical protein